MAQKKRLQVFVSSTYTDLQEERQAAVQAILTAGHIPAGMELFAAGDESQVNTIRRWIDESDVFMLILGGRYGSIEPTSQKSYIHLEYEYALDQGKPLFSVVIKEDRIEQKVRDYGTGVIERKYTEKLNDFRELVLTKMVRFWNDPRDIKLAIMETLMEFSRRDDLVGWVPGDQAIDAGPLAEELARLAKENAELRERLKKTADQSAMYSGLTFWQMYDVLATEPIDDFGTEGIDFDRLRYAAHIFGDPRPALLHLFWDQGKSLVRGGIHLDPPEGFHQFLLALDRCGLVEIEAGSGGIAYKCSDSGKNSFFA